MVDFVASNRWFSNFKKRNNLSHYKESGEENFVNKKVVSEWTENTLDDILMNFDPENIFNADETGPFYGLLPSHTYNEKGESNEQARASKKRVTVLLCSNMSGSKKMIPYVIGRSENPTCFAGIKNLAINYESNKSSWMTVETFNKFLSDLNLIQNEKGEIGCLIIDNAPIHKMRILAPTHF